jgi:hypothetical protein
MEISKKEFINQLSLLVDHYNLPTIDLIKDLNLPEYCKLLAYKLFTKDIHSYFINNNEIYQAYRYLVEYLNLLEQNSYYDFKK